MESKATEHPLSGQVEVLIKLSLIEKVTNEADGEETLGLTQSGREAARDLAESNHVKGKMPFIVNSCTQTTKEERSDFAGWEHKMSCENAWENGKLVEEFMRFEEAGTKVGVKAKANTFGGGNRLGSKTCDTDHSDHEGNNHKDIDKEDSVHCLMTEMIGDCDGIKAKDNDSDRSRGL